MPKTGHIADEIDISSVVIEPNPGTPAPLEEAAVRPAEDEEDMVLISIKEDESPDQVLKAVLYGMAEEQSSLRFLRKKKDSDGKDTSYISLKRGTLLKYMADTQIQKMALTKYGGGSDIDLKSPKFREIFKMLIETIHDTLEEIHLPTEYKDMFFSALPRRIEEWEQKAARTLKAMSASPVR